jgi:hypothetical protein
MGLKGYRLWVMGQLDSTCRAPPREVYFHEMPRDGGEDHLAVLALDLVPERRGALTPGGCQAGHTGRTGCHQLNALWLSLPPGCQIGYTGFAISRVSDWLHGLCHLPGVRLVTRACHLPGVRLVTRACHLPGVRLVTWACHLPGARLVTTWACDVCLGVS